MTRQRLALAAAVVAVAVLRLVTRGHAADSWDAVGFMNAVHDFDLAAFQPHFPGYPVYVALCKVLRSPQLVSAIASAATALALFRLSGGGRGGFVAVALWAGALGPWLTGNAALADATATAFVAAAFAALTFEDGALLGGVAIALAIGTRVSYWPLALSFFVIARDRKRALAAAAVATVAWLVPFVAVVGARTLVALGRVHVAGHFADWGGAVTTRPDVAARAFAFARDLVYDGIWPSLYALVAALVLGALLVRRPPPTARRIAVVVVVPYALWALLAQNVLEQPRHLLPLIAATIVAIGRAAAHDRGRVLIGVALAALAFAASTPLVVHRGPPAATVVAARVTQLYGSDAVVFARRSARLMQAHTADRVSDILGTLERLSVLPHHVLFVAEELAADAPSQPADGSLHFCRDPRVDRQSPCVTLRSYNLQP